MSVLWSWRRWWIAGIVLAALVSGYIGMNHYAWTHADDVTIDARGVMSVGSSLAPTHLHFTGAAAQRIQDALNTTAESPRASDDGVIGLVVPSDNYSCPLLAGPTYQYHLVFSDDGVVVESADMTSADCHWSVSTLGHSSGRNDQQRAILRAVYQATDQQLPVSPDLSV